MKLRVRLFAVLRERAGTEYLDLDLPGRSSIDVATLKLRLAEAYPEVGDLGFASGVVGTAYVSDDTTLEAGAEVALLPPVSGGSGEDPFEVGVFELAAEPLDVAGLGARVAHPSCGAVITFLGVTRDRNRGEDVTQLDYEAFEAMAGPEMGRIFERCRQTFGPASAPLESGEPDRELALRMLCVHRTGRVPVGEPSVLIAVASPHRDAAFLAARFLIDELKQSLPVWKKEHYEAGHHWIGDRS
ncbi:MAG: molybdenum cofactor biosynthesis protein MoaE [Planctomycetota bacterium]|nr:molybdenum cofactor biosynthesis protein MoaE [Planctomycetota bacterium]